MKSPTLEAQQKKAREAIHEKFVKHKLFAKGVWGFDYSQFESFLDSQIAEAYEAGREAEREICKQVYIEGADWSEWGISDEEAAEKFEEERKVITSQKE